MNSATLPQHRYRGIKAHTCSSHTPCTCLPVTRAHTIKYLGVLIDQHLKWDQHINALIPKIRKLIYVFKNLNSCADLNALKVVYFALCQSLLSYCISAWGGAAKTIVLPLERAQRAVLKVMTKKPFRYPTKQLYSDTLVLTVRQLFIMMTVLRKHSRVPYDPTIKSRKRRSDRVCFIHRHRTTFVSRHFKVFSSKIYNKVNKILDIYPNTKRIAKFNIQKWLLTLNYSETESLLT